MVLLKRGFGFTTLSTLLEIFAILSSRLTRRRKASDMSIFSKRILSPGQSCANFHRSAEGEVTLQENPPKLGPSHVMATGRSPVQLIVPVVGDCVCDVLKRLLIFNTTYPTHTCCPQRSKDANHPLHHSLVPNSELVPSIEYPFDWSCSPPRKKC